MPHEKAEGYDGKGLLKDLMGCGDVIKRKLLRPLCEPKPWGNRGGGHFLEPPETQFQFYHLPKKAFSFFRRRGYWQAEISPF